MVIPHAGGGAGRSARDITLNIFCRKYYRLRLCWVFRPNKSCETALPEALQFRTSRLSLEGSVGACLAGIRLDSGRGNFARDIIDAALPAALWAGFLVLRPTYPVGTDFPISF